MPDDSVMLGELAEEFSARVRQGQLPDIEDCARGSAPAASVPWAGSSAGAAATRAWPPSLRLPRPSS